MKKTLIALAVSLAAALPTAAPAQMMHADPPVTAAEYFAARTGTKVSIVVRVVARVRTDLVGELLERDRGTTYTASGRRVHIFVARETPVAMGTLEDVRPGAVVVVDAVVTARGRSDAKQLVPITRYAKIRTGAR